MGLFKNLFGSSKESKKEIKTETSLLEKLVDIGIDFNHFNQEDATQMELTIDDEMNKVAKKSFKQLTDQFFTSCFIKNHINGGLELFLMKEESTEKDFKELIDKLSVSLGNDISGRGDFTYFDLSSIRSKSEENVFGLRRWIDPVTNYVITINYSDDQDVLLWIFKPQD